MNVPLKKRRSAPVACGAWMALAVLGCAAGKAYTFTVVLDAAGCPTSAETDQPRAAKPSCAGKEPCVEVSKGKKDKVFVDASSDLEPDAKPGSQLSLWDPDASLGKKKWTFRIDSVTYPPGLDRAEYRFGIFGVPRRDGCGIDPTVIINK